jgi:gas vesicle protein
MNLENLTNLSRKDVLNSLGLAPKATDYLLPAIGIFAAGAFVGATTALMFAPKSGAKLRRQIRDEMKSKLDELEERLHIGGESKSESKSKGEFKGESKPGQRTESKQEHGQTQKTQDASKRAA